MFLFKGFEGESPVIIIEFVLLICFIKKLLLKISFILKFFFICLNSNEKEKGKCYNIHVPWYYKRIILSEKLFRGDLSPGIFLSLWYTAEILSPGLYALTLWSCVHMSWLRLCGAHKIFRKYTPLESYGVSECSRRVKIIFVLFIILFTLCNCVYNQITVFIK